jgi:hypothetical protein
MLGHDRPLGKRGGGGEMRITRCGTAAKWGSRECVQDQKSKLKIRSYVHDVLLPLDTLLPTLNIFYDALPVIEFLVTLPENFAVCPDVFL